MAAAQLGLSAQEAEIYDRQIRLWGVESQQRMQNSRVLLAGKFRGVLAEIAKNLILAGIKLSISDPSAVCPEDTAANFFVTAEDVGSRRDSSSCPRIQELNPLSNVAVLEPPLLPAQGDVPSGGGNLEATCAAHTVVVLGDASAEEQAAVSTAAASAGVACIILNNSGLYTLAHLCLGKHTFTQKGTDGPITYDFPSRGDALAMRWPAGLRIRRAERYGVFFLLRAWDTLRSEHLTTAITVEQLCAAAVALAGEFGVEGSVIDAQAAQRIVAGHRAEASPVAAFVGGVLAVEVMKVLQCKAAPAFVFIALDGLTGHAQSVDPRIPFGSKYTPPGLPANANSSSAVSDGDADDDVQLVDGDVPATAPGAADADGDADDCVLLD